MATVSFLNMHVVTSHGAIMNAISLLRRKTLYNQSIITRHFTVASHVIRRRIKNFYFPISCRRVNPSVFDCARILWGLFI